MYALFQAGQTAALDENRRMESGTSAQPLGFRAKDRLDWLHGSSIRSTKVVPRVFAVVASGLPPRSQCTHHTEEPRWPQEP